MAKKPPDGSGVFLPANQDKKPRVADTPADTSLRDAKKMYDFPSPVGAKLVVLASRKKPKSQKPKSS